jgi:hypothetical protein
MLYSVYNVCKCIQIDDYERIDAVVECFRYTHTLLRFHNDDDEPSFRLLKFRLPSQSSTGSKEYVLYL